MIWFLIILIVLVSCFVFEILEKTEYELPFLVKIFLGLVSIPAKLLFCIISGIYIIGIYLVGLAVLGIKRFRHFFQNSNFDS